MIVYCTTESFARLSGEFDSDSLYGLIFATYKDIVGSKPPEFKVSSPYPHISGKRFYKLPNIFSLLKLDSFKRKSLRHIKYIPEETLEKLLKILSDHIVKTRIEKLEEPKNSQVIKLLTEAQVDFPIKPKDENRVSIDVFSGASVPFSADSLFFVKPSGIWFYIEGDIPKDTLKYALEIRGLGGERSSGSGVFDKVSFSNESINFDSAVGYLASVYLQKPKDTGRFLGVTEKRKLKFFKGKIVSIKVVSDGALVIGNANGRLEYVDKETPVVLNGQGVTFGGNN